MAATPTTRSARRLPRPARATRATACAAALALAGASAQAALTENIAVSPVAMSLGNAVTADPPGLDAIHFNPAGLSKIDKNLRSDTLFGASIRVAAGFHQPEGFDIGGWTEDPLNGTVS